MPAVGGRGTELIDRDEVPKHDRAADDAGSNCNRQQRYASKVVMRRMIRLPIRIMNPANPSIA